MISIPTVIFDVDGTLCDVTKPLRHLKVKPKDWDAFHIEACTAPIKPEVVRDLKRFYDLGYRVIVMTSRRITWKKQTKRWLVNNGIPHHQLMMRREGDHRPSAEVKAEHLSNLLHSGHKVIAAWDDDPAVCQMWRDNNVHAHEVPGWAEALKAVQPQ